MSDYVYPPSSDWESTTGHSGFAYTITAPPHSQAWTAAGYPYATTTSPMDNYGFGQTLPPPNPHFRGMGTNPEYYHVGGSAGYSFPTTGELIPPTWQTAGSGFDAHYAYDHSASPCGSETGDGSPTLSENGATPKPALKEKKFQCYRAQSDASGMTSTCNKAFARKADLQRHEHCVHDKHKIVRHECTFKKCARKGDNGFLRKDHLTEHMRHYHHKDIPKKGRRSSGIVDEEEVEVIQSHGQRQFLTL